MRMVIHGTFLQFINTTFGNILLGDYQYGQPGPRHITNYDDYLCIVISLNDTTW